jgi:hypothetical protein
MLYVWTSAVTKISIAHALLRLAVKKCHRIVLWCIIVVTILIGLMFWLILLFDCHPISFFWQQVDQTTTGRCLPKPILLNIAYFYSVSTILCDITLGILPAFLVWNLQMNFRTKFAVGGILSLGAMYVIPSPLYAQDRTNSSKCECCSGLSNPIPAILLRPKLSLYVLSHLLLFSFDKV